MTDKEIDDLRQRCSAETKALIAHIDTMTADNKRLREELDLRIELTNAYHDIFGRQLGRHVQDTKAYDDELNINFVSGLFGKMAASKGKIYAKLKLLEATDD